MTTVDAAREALLLLITEGIDATEEVAAFEAAIRAESAETLAAHEPVVETTGDYDINSAWVACSCGWQRVGPRGGVPKGTDETWADHFRAALDAATPAEDEERT